MSREPTYLTVTTPQHLYPNSAVFRLELRSRSSTFPVLTFPIQLTEVTEFQLRVHYDIASAPRSSCCYPHYITSPVLAVIPVISITLPLYLLSIALKFKNPFFMVLTMKRIENKKAPLGISLFYHVDQPRGYTLLLSVYISTLTPFRASLISNAFKDYLLTSSSVLFLYGSALRYTILKLINPFFIV